jgi:succinyl-CoA synthetase alpha subunit
MKFSDKMESNLDSLAANGTLLYAVNRMKGMSESEAVFEAIRATAQMMTIALFSEKIPTPDQLADALKLRETARDKMLKLDNDG